MMAAPLLSSIRRERGQLSPDGWTVFRACLGPRRRRDLFTATRTGGDRSLTPSIFPQVQNPGACTRRIDLAGRRQRGNVLLTRGIDRARHSRTCSRGDQRARLVLARLVSVPNDLSADGKAVLFSGGEKVADLNMPFTFADRWVPAVRLGEGTGTALSPDGKWAVGPFPTRVGTLVLLPPGWGDEAANPGLN